MWPSWLPLGHPIPKEWKISPALLHGEWVLHASRAPVRCQLLWSWTRGLAHFYLRNLHIELETQLSRHLCLVKDIWETVIGYTSVTTCCKSLRFSRCHFLGSVAGSLAGKRFSRFVNPQRRDEELCRAGIEKGVSYGFILHCPDNLTSLHFIPAQISEVYYNQLLWRMRIKHLISAIFPLGGAECLVRLASAANTQTMAHCSKNKLLV